MRRQTLFASVALPLVLGACTGVIGQSSVDEDEGQGGAGGTEMTSTSSSTSGQVSSGNGGGAVTSSSSGGSMSSSSSSAASSSSSSAASSSSSSAASSSSGGPVGVCGNLMCDMGEACSNCPSDCGKGSGPDTTGLDSEEQAFLATINDYRMSNGRSPLKACVTLNRAAQGHSEDMRDNNYFDHTGLNGSKFSERACDACYAPACPVQTAMGENIAAGNSSASGTFTQWKNSPGHNANMLSANYTVIGIGRAIGGGQYGSYWTNVFGGADDGTCN